MGNMYSQTSDVIIKVNPCFYTLNDDKVRRETIKKFSITQQFNFNTKQVKPSKNKEYIFGIKNNTFKIIKSSFTKKEFIFHIKYTNPVYISELESYVKDAFSKHCNSGDSLKANFIKEKKYKGQTIYFNVDDIVFNYF